MGTLQEELKKLKVEPPKEDEEECEHDEVEDGYCLMCDEPAHEFMDTDYFVDRAKDFD